MRVAIATLSPAKDLLPVKRQLGPSQTSTRCYEDRRPLPMLMIPWTREANGSHDGNAHRGGVKEIVGPGDRRLTRAGSSWPRLSPVPVTIRVEVQDPNKGSSPRRQPLSLSQKS